MSVDPAPEVPSPAPVSDQYAELAELAGQLIHEIKNHLGTLALNLQLLAEDLQETESQRERRARQRVDRLQRECQRLTDLSTDFLRFAQVRELALAPTRVKDLVDDLVDFFGPTAAQAGVEIKTFLPADLPVVMIDVDLVKQALLNLMINAQQAMQKGGQLTIQAEGRHNEVILSFIDTGVGVAPELLGKIFKPFFTMRPGGSGLGLPTARKTIEAHGGRIDVQSQLGRGTKFTVALPVAKIPG